MVGRGGKGGKCPPSPQFYIGGPKDGRDPWLTPGRCRQADEGNVTARVNDCLQMLFTKLARSALPSPSSPCRDLLPAKDAGRRRLIGLLSSPLPKAGERWRGEAMTVRGRCGRAICWNLAAFLLAFGGVVVKHRKLRSLHVNAKFHHSNYTNNKCNAKLKIDFNINIL